LYNSKNRFEFGVSVLHGRFCDGVKFCKIVGSVVSSKTSADFLLCLYLSHTTLTGIVVVRETQVGEKREQEFFDFEDSLLECFELIIKIGKAFTSNQG
jgi:hypothetical protein